jgi:hypothetical protein
MLTGPGETKSLDCAVSDGSVYIVPVTNDGDGDP